MQDKQYVTPAFVDNFLKQYHSFIEKRDAQSEDMLYEALVNSLVYSDDLGEPLKGFKEDLALFRKNLEEKLEVSKSLLCTKICEMELKIDIRPEELRGKIREFIKLSNLLGAILESQGLPIVPSEIRQDTVAISMLIILFKKATDNLNNYCGCP